MASALTAAGFPASRDGDPGERGRTTVDDRVLERIAQQVVREVEGAGGSVRRLLGVAVGASGLDQDAQVSVTTAGGAAALTLQLSVAYPASVAGTARAVRQQLIERFHGLTDHSLSRVDITVTAVHADLVLTRRVL